MFTIKKGIKKVIHNLSTKLSTSKFEIVDNVDNFIHIIHRKKSSIYKGFRAYKKVIHMLSTKLSTKKFKIVDNVDNFNVDNFVDKLQIDYYRKIVDNFVDKLWITFFISKKIDKLGLFWLWIMWITLSTLLWITKIIINNS